MVDVSSRGSFAADARADADPGPGEVLGDMRIVPTSPAFHGVEVYYRHLPLYEDTLK